MTSTRTKNLIMIAIRVQTVGEVETTKTILDYEENAYKETHIKRRL